MYREMVYRVYCVQYTEEKAITGVKFFLYYGAFLTGSVPEKSFWQVWLPARFSGVWAGGNPRIDGSKKNRRNSVDTLVATHLGS
jgi:hypothetical protein